MKIKEEMNVKRAGTQRAAVIIWKCNPWGDTVEREETHENSRLFDDYFYDG